MALSPVAGNSFVSTLNIGFYSKELKAVLANQSENSSVSKPKKPGFLDKIFEKLDTIGIIFLVDVAYQIANLFLTMYRKPQDYGFWAGSVAGILRGVCVRWFTVLGSLRLISKASLKFSEIFYDPKGARPKLEGLLSFSFGALIDLIIGNKFMLFVFDKLMRPSLKGRLMPLARFSGYRGD